MIIPSLCDWTRSKSSRQWAAGPPGAPHAAQHVDNIASHSSTGLGKEWTSQKLHSTASSQKRHLPWTGFAQERRAVTFAVLPILMSATTHSPQRHKDLPRGNPWCFPRIMPPPPSHKETGAWLKSGLNSKVIGHIQLLIGKYLNQNEGERWLQWATKGQNARLVCERRPESTDHTRKHLEGQTEYTS